MASPIASQQFDMEPEKQSRARLKTMNANEKTKNGSMTLNIRFPTLGISPLKANSVQSHSLSLADMLFMVHQ